MRVSVVIDIVSSCSCIEVPCFGKSGSYGLYF